MAGHGTVSDVIGYLEGKAADVDLLVVGGVGYLVHTVIPLTVGADVRVWVRTVVRENDISMFGFGCPAERDLFDALTKVNGVGPKVALNILTLGSAAVATAVRDKDAKALAKAPGIGPKKAEQIVTSVSLPAGVAATLADGPDVLGGLVDALAGLGFDPAAARAAVQDLIAADVDPADEPLMLRRAMNALR